MPIGLLVTLAIASVMSLPVLRSEGDGGVAGAGEVFVDGLEHLWRDFVGEDDMGATEDAAGGDTD